MSESRSDIPLHTITVHKSGAGPTSSLQDTHSELPENNMHTSIVRSAAVRSTNRNLKSKGKGKMREQYADESDEEATLLGHVERHGDGDVDAEDVEQPTQMRHLEGSRLSRVGPIDPGTVLVRSYALKAFLHPQQVAGPTRQVSYDPIPSGRYVLNTARSGTDNLVHHC